MEVMGFVTAGGQSSRMGRDKAWLEVDGRAMIERVIDAIAPVTCNVAIIANSDEYSRLGLPLFSDTLSGVGPLEAIRTALRNSRTPRVVLAACDLPFVTSELFAYLLAAADEETSVVPLDPEGRLEPLCAVYSGSALDELERFIEEGGRKVSRLFELVPVRVVQFAEISNLPGADLFFENVNTPEEYLRAAGRVGRSG
ncbi:MAG TPA: molybdenum cofactor guanylyltransferase, partial [Blastocatellia bacterium]|nr:molybdenum cofactor guanylyltransferase [Blastocatellia bacterium]